ncbi:LysR family transcriptional regulator [Sphingomonas fennica]|uniref:HTH lysR-type domain-containing protein n=1 Tax=Edaphosphingomonas fennica TaxID=114404 RepID=A0A2T4I5I7_9SPHN|nr:LysR family transcriptional regulator [Sphingomonas fennica]PTD25483.1 hypothetical protein CV103_05770 [Sphingomonas fennica]
MEILPEEILISRQDQHPIDPVRIRTGIDRIHLETALAVHLHGTFRRTAESLNMKTATVNRRIRDLEFQLGTRLFERQKRRLVPTPSGLVFLRNGAKILESFHTLVEGVRRMADGRVGQIVIGYHGAIVPGELYAILFDPDPNYPDIRHVPVELTHDRMCEALLGGAIDVAIVRGNPVTLAHRAAPLWNERILVILPQDHLLAGRPLLQWPDLVNETFLISGYDPSEAIRKLLEERFSPLGATANVEVHYIGASAIMQMVGARRGICLCLDSMLSHNFTGTVFRELSGPCGPEYVTSFACWREDSPNPALKRFLRRVLHRDPATGDAVDGAEITEPC